MPNALVARFPLGLYQGHQQDGRPEEIPQVTRVFSALVNAAWRGIDAEDTGGELRPSPGSARALAWLETHPPAALALPARLATRRLPVTSYRREGVFDKGRDRVVGKAIGQVTALDGPIRWIWGDDFPEDVAVALDALCADVAYLGESDSPVVLELHDVADADVTHRRVTVSAFGARGTIETRVPALGRREALDAAHAAANPAKRPSTSQDKFAMGGGPTSSRSAGTESTAVARYRAVDAPPPEGPWSRVVLVPARGHVASTDTVAWCVAFHRALAHRLGDDAPAVITGSYSGGARRPANRVAVHLLDGSLTAAHGVSGRAFAVLIPSDIEPLDAAALATALRGLTTIYRGRAGELHLGHGSDVDATTFWPDPAATPGTVRVWRSVTPVVPDTRPQGESGERRWTLSDAALLSIGFVARDRFDLPGRGTARYLATVDAVRRGGTRVGDVHRVADSHVGRYAHKLPESVVAQPFHVTVDLAGLWSPRALVAIGQSRHLGGGLLAPVDVPEALAQMWFER